MSYEVSIINNARWETAAFRVCTEDTAWTMATIPRDVSCPVTCTSWPSVSHRRETIYDLAILLPHNRKHSCERHEWSFIHRSWVIERPSPPTPLPFLILLYPLLKLLLSLSSSLRPVFSNLHLIIVACASVMLGLFTGTWQLIKDYTTKENGNPRSVPTHCPQSRSKRQIFLGLLLHPWWNSVGPSLTQVSCR